MGPQLYLPHMRRELC